MEEKWKKKTNKLHQPFAFCKHAVFFLFLMYPIVILFIGECLNKQVFFSFPSKSKK